jgi:hypothetical protein
MAKRIMYLGFEFFSRFADASSLTTTTNTSLESRPELSIYARAHPGLEPAKLYERHRWGIERFRTQKRTAPVPLPTTLIAVAREYDRIMARRQGVSLRIRILSPPPGEAPAHIRAAWVGCVLPVYATTDDPKISRHQKGVISRQGTDSPPGFAVQVIDALRELELHDAGAARWWRENTPHVLKPGQLFVYPADSCALVEETDKPG